MVVPSIVLDDIDPYGGRCQVVDISHVSRSRFQSSEVSMLGQVRACDTSVSSVHVRSGGNEQKAKGFTRKYKYQNGVPFKYHSDKKKKGNDNDMTEKTRTNYTAGMEDDGGAFIVVVLYRDEIFEEMTGHDIIPHSLRDKPREDWTDDEWKHAATKIGSAIWDLWVT